MSIVIFCADRTCLPKAADRLPQQEAGAHCFKEQAPSRQISWSRIQDSQGGKAEVLLWLI